MLKLPDSVSSRLNLRLLPPDSVPLKFLTSLDTLILGTKPTRLKLEGKRPLLDPEAVVKDEGHDDVESNVGPNQSEVAPSRIPARADRR